MVHGTLPYHHHVRPNTPSVPSRTAWRDTGHKTGGVTILEYNIAGPARYGVREYWVEGGDNALGAGARGHARATDGEAAH